MRIRASEHSWPRSSVLLARNTPQLSRRLVRLARRVEEANIEARYRREGRNHLGAWMLTRGPYLRQWRCIRAQLLLRPSLVSVRDSARHLGIRSHYSFLIDYVRDWALTSLRVIYLAHVAQGLPKTNVYPRQNKDQRWESLVIMIALSSD